MRKLWTVVAIAAGACLAATLLIAAILLFLQPAAPDVRTDAQATPRATVAVPAPLPEANPARTGTSIAGAASPAWIDTVADATGIPKTALQAYAGATLTVAEQNPGCGLSWNTLAAIGWIESRHGEIHGRTLAATGKVTPALYGVALDGDGFALIPDSDKGTVDGDAKGDRAVGPLQFLPNSWHNWHVDASGDGVEDVQNIFDASLAAAHYLCRAGGDLGTQEGWRTAVLAYNSSNQYLQDVIDDANGYAADAG